MCGVGLGLVALAIAGCKPAIDPAALGYDADAARAWQVQADAELMEEVSPLSAIAAHYVESGETLYLAEEAGVLVQRDRDGEGISITSPSDPGVRRLGRFSLAIGPQSGTTRVVVHDPDAPTRRAWQTEHGGRRNWFPIDPAMIVAARLRLSETTTEVTLQTTRGLSKALPQVGTLSLTIGGEAVSLEAFEAGPDAMLVPFTDPTNGVETYPVGRYVSVQRPEQGDGVVVDFNRATNPWCAYSEHYNCPIPPKNNAVPVDVRAGEGLPHAIEGAPH